MQAYFLMKYDRLDHSSTYDEWVDSRTSKFRQVIGWIQERLNDTLYSEDVKESMRMRLEAQV